MLGKYDRERSLAHDLFILALDDLASIVGKQNNKVPWRVALGNDRHMLGEFAEYIVDRIRLSKERIELIETMIWAQDHRNQIIHCVGESVSSQDAKIRIMKQFKFNESQAQLIVDMRVRAFCKEERIKIHDELVGLIHEANAYQNWM